MQAIPREQLSAVILAGGRASRMAGHDKGLLPFGRTLLVEHVLQRVRTQVHEVFINANRNHALYGAFGVPVLSDLMPDYAGPLAGLQCGLRACMTPYLLSVPCDAPFLPQNLADILGTALRTNAADAAVAVTVDRAGVMRRQPVFCLMKRALLGSLDDYLASGQRKVGAWHDTLAMVEVLFDDTTAFSNINTPEQLQAARAP